MRPKDTIPEVELVVEKLIELNIINEDDIVLEQDEYKCDVEILPSPAEMSDDQLELWITNFPDIFEVFSFCLVNPYYPVYENIEKWVDKVKQTQANQQKEYEARLRQKYTRKIIGEVTFQEMQTFFQSLQQKFSSDRTEIIETHPELIEYAGSHKRVEYVFEGNSILFPPINVMEQIERTLNDYEGNDGEKDTEPVETVQSVDQSVPKLQWTGSITNLCEYIRAIVVTKLFKDSNGRDIDNEGRIYDSLDQILKWDITAKKVYDNTRNRYDAVKDDKTALYIYKRIHAYRKALSSILCEYKLEEGLFTEDFDADLSKATQENVNTGVNWSGSKNDLFDVILDLYISKQFEIDGQEADFLSVCTAFNAIVENVYITPISVKEGILQKYEDHLVDVTNSTFDITHLKVFHNDLVEELWKDKNERDEKRKHAIE